MSYSLVSCDRGGSVLSSHHAETRISNKRKVQWHATEEVNMCVLLHFAQKQKEDTFMNQLKKAQEDRRVQEREVPPQGVMQLPLAEEKKGVM